MSQVIDSWRNANGELVTLNADGRLSVQGTNGQPVKALNARTCDRAAAPAAPTIPRPFHNADANGVVELPFMAIRPYFAPDAPTMRPTKK